MKVWFELPFHEIDFSMKEFIDNSNINWVPMHKGGGYRKHYGLHDYVMNLHDIWDPTKTKSNVRRGDPQFYFKKGLTWSTLANNLSVRRSPSGFVFDTKGSMCFVTDDSYLSYFEGLLNSKVASYYMTFLSPTLDFNQGAMGKLPVVITDEALKNKIDMLSNTNIEISKSDWDSFENSWDFIMHPLVQYNKRTSATINNCSLKQSFLCWQEVCQKRFDQLKANEEELNHIFIDMYDLQEELTPDIEEKDVTVRKADLKRDISSLISYAVGCIFGRYSLDIEGLAYAGGEWDSSKYKTFIPDDDNCIPITDEEYFEDDIVGRFCEFLKVVFGEESLEENLNYVAQALGNKGNTSREIIRNYFLNDFFKDHCSTYSVTGSGKRPIYWLFDAGKQNGFKCLIYMHRYDKDTVNRVRSEYLKKMQDAIEGALKNAEYAVDNSSSAVDRAAATRKRDKYIKQLNEIRAYYPALSHMALQRIEIDLDDGVKTNYAKFQGIETVDENGKKQKVDLLAKI